MKVKNSSLFIQFFLILIVCFFVSHCQSNEKAIVKNIPKMPEASQKTTQIQKTEDPIKSKYFKVSGQIQKVKRR